MNAEIEAHRLEEAGDDSGCVKEMEHALVLRQQSLATREDEQALALAAERLIVKYNTMAVRSFKSNDYLTAVDLLERALRLTDARSRCFVVAPDVRLRLRGTTFNNYGCLERRRGKPEAALNYLRLSIEHEGNQSAPTFVNMSAILNQLGRKEEAVGCARRAIGLVDMGMAAFPGIGAIAYHNLAMALEGTDTEACHDAYEKAYQIALSELGATSGTTVSIEQNMKKFLEFTKFRPQCREVLKNAASQLSGHFLPEIRQTKQKVNHQVVAGTREQPRAILQAVHVSAKNEVSQQTPKRAQKKLDARSRPSQEQPLSQKQLKRNSKTSDVQETKPHSVSEPSEASMKGQANKPAVAPKPPPKTTNSTTRQQERTQESQERIPPAPQEQKVHNPQPPTGGVPTKSLAPRRASQPKVVPDKEERQPVIKPSEIPQPEESLPISKGEESFATFVTKLNALLRGEEEFEKRYTAAVKIQCMVRKAIAKMSVKKRRELRTEIQKQTLLREGNAGKKVVAIFRRLHKRVLQQRRKVDREQEVVKRQNREALRIQCAIRQFLARQSARRRRMYVSKYHHSLRVLQCWFRQTIARRAFTRMKSAKLLKLKEQANTEQREKAVTDIQRVFRAHQTFAVASRLQGNVKLAKEHEFLSRKFVAATRIQCAWRRHVAFLLKASISHGELIHRVYAEKNERRRCATIVIQSLARGMLVRRAAMQWHSLSAQKRVIAQNNTRFVAATKIECCWKSHRARSIVGSAAMARRLKITHEITCQKEIKEMVAVKAATKSVSSNRDSDSFVGPVYGTPSSQSEQRARVEESAAPNSQTQQGAQAENESRARAEESAPSSSQTEPRARTEESAAANSQTQQGARAEDESRARCEESAPTNPQPEQPLLTSPQPSEDSAVTVLPLNPQSQQSLTQSFESHNSPKQVVSKNVPFVAAAESNSVSQPTEDDMSGDRCILPENAPRQPVVPLRAISYEKVALLRKYQREELQRRAATKMCDDKRLVDTHDGECAEAKKEDIRNLAARRIQALLRGHNERVLFRERRVLTAEYIDELVLLHKGPVPHAPSKAKVKKQGNLFDSENLRFTALKKVTATIDPLAPSRCRAQLSATVIQAFARFFFSWHIMRTRLQRCEEIKACAVLTLQGFARILLAKKEKDMRMQTVQSTQHDRLVGEQRLNQQRCILILQSHFRCICSCAYVQFKRKTQAVGVLVGFWQIIHAKNELVKKKESVQSSCVCEELAELHDHAARRITRFLRAAVARRQMLKRRGDVEMHLAEEVRRQEAALHIQCTYRRMEARNEASMRRKEKEQKWNEIATSQTQLRAEGLQKEEGKDAAAATAIQKSYRQHLAKMERRRLQLENKREWEKKKQKAEAEGNAAPSTQPEGQQEDGHVTAATSIQKSYRRHLAKMERRRRQLENKSEWEKKRQEAEAEAISDFPDLL